MPRPPSSPSPPPAAFPFTTGGFDFPHASTSPPNVSRTASTSAARNALRSLAEPTPAVYDATSSPRDTARRVRTRTSNRRGPLHRLFGPPRDNDAADNLSRRPPTANPNRPRATPSERYLRRSQARTREQRLADMDATNDVLDSLSGLPINDPSLNQWKSESRPVRPKFSVFMMLPWQNTRPRASSKKNMYYPGLTADGLRPSCSKGHVSVLSCEPLLTGGYGRN